jgi:hypothetical protein
MTHDDMADATAYALDGFKIREPIDNSPEACRQRALDRIQGVTLRQRAYRKLAKLLADQVDKAAWSFLSSPPTDDLVIKPMRFDYGTHIAKPTDVIKIDTI